MQPPVRPQPVQGGRSNFATPGARLGRIARAALCEANSRHFERDPIPYALETDWPVGAAGFEPLRFRIGNAICFSTRWNLCNSPRLSASHSKCHEIGGVSFIRICSRLRKTSGIPVSVSEADSLVSLFKQPASRRQADLGRPKVREIVASS